MNKEKFSISIDQKTPFKVEDLLKLEGMSLSQNEILNEFTFFLKKHYSQFGTKPYHIEFEPIKGYVLRSNSEIGKISTFNFEVHLNPKFNDLSIGKCIGLSQLTSANLLKINSNDVVNELFSEKYEYSTIEYLAYGLIDSVMSIQYNGIGKNYREIIGTSTKLGGAVKIQESINSGGFNPPFQDLIEDNFNILPNIIIKKGLLVALDYCGSQDLRKLLNTALSFFSEVTMQFEDSFLESSLFYYFNLPRPDYEKGLIFAKAILSGGLLGQEGKSISIPSITMNLDLLFEEYVSKYIKRILNVNRYNVSIQKEIPHSVNPKFESKSLILDLFIKDKKSGSTFVVDLKNKYSEYEKGPGVKISNQDIFQISYYARTTSSKYTFLLFPSTKPQYQFPLRASEGESAYETKVKRSLSILKEKQYFYFPESSMKLITYHIDLSGSLHNTNRSIASFCQMINFVEKYA